MIIEINKDIDRYQESVAMGLSAKQLIFSVASLLCGAGLILLLYRYIGLTASAYVAVPLVAPIALGGFYTYNGMDFYEFMKKKFQFAFANKALAYVSTEGEQAIQEFAQERMGNRKGWFEFVKKNGNASKAVTGKENNQKGNEDFQAMKKKTLRMAVGCVAALVIAAAGTVVYKHIR